MIAMQSDNFEQNNLNLQSETYSEQPQNPEYVGDNYNMYQQPYQQPQSPPGAPLDPSSSN